MEALAVLGMGVLPLTGTKNKGFLAAEGEEEDETARGSTKWCG